MDIHGVDRLRAKDALYEAICNLDRAARSIDQAGESDLALDTIDLATQVNTIRKKIQAIDDSIQLEECEAYYAEQRLR